MRVILFCLILLKILNCEQPLAPYTIVSAGRTNYCFNRADFVKVRNNLDAIADYKSNISFLEYKNAMLTNQVAELDLQYKGERESQSRENFTWFFRGAGAGFAVAAVGVVVVILRSAFGVNNPGHR